MLVAVSGVRALVLCSKALIHAETGLPPPGLLMPPACRVRENSCVPLVSPKVDRNVSSSSSSTHGEPAHRNCCCSLGCRSPSWGTLCCTWSSSPPGSHSASAFSSSPLRSRSCTGSPDLQEAASFGSFLLWWRQSQVGSSRCCLGRRCRSP